MNDVSEKSKWSFADNLIMALRHNQMTQKEFAKRLGVSVSAVYGWTRGNVAMTCYTLKKTSRILNVSMEELMEGVEVD